jgi:GH43 family beta-xylosidase
VLLWADSDLSKEHDASIFRVEMRQGHDIQGEGVKKERGNRQWEQMGKKRLFDLPTVIVEEPA